MDKAIDEICQKLKPLFGRSIDMLYFRYRFESDPKRKKRIEQCILSLYENNIDSLLCNDKILFEPPVPQLCNGSFDLGTVMYGDRPVARFGINKSEMLRHVGLFGMTGAGKSSVAFLLIDRLLSKGVKFFIFDWKRQYRDYLSVKPDSDILIFGVGNKNVPTLEFNPLIPPPFLEIDQHVEILCQIISSSYYVGEGVVSILRDAITAVYAQFDVPNTYPTFFDVMDYVKKQERKGRARDWIESTIRCLEAICYGGLGRITGVQRPTMEISELLNHNVILELQGLGASQKKFIIQSLLFYFYHFVMGRKSREELKNVLFFEEAHHLLNEQGKTPNESITDVLLKEIREFCVGAVILDQNPSKISVPALSNNYTTIGMYLKHGADLMAISKAMFLDEEQRKCLGKLECGWGIIRLAGRIYTPFVVKFDYLKIAKGTITDQNVAAHMAKRGYATYSSQNTAYSAGITVSQSYCDKDKRQKTMAGNMLKDIKEHPYCGVASRFKRIGVSPRRGKEIIKTLISEGILNQVEIKERDGRIILLEIKNEGDKTEGGVEHRYWNNKIAQANLNAGYRVEREKRIDGNGYIDQAINVNGQNIAIEIETGKSTPLQTIKRDLSLGFTRVICVATTEDAYSKIKTKLTENNLVGDSRISLVMASKYDSSIIKPTHLFPSSNGKTNN